MVADARHTKEAESFYGCWSLASHSPDCRFEYTWVVVG
jgi:hypothetical protein